MRKFAGCLLVLCCVAAQAATASSAEQRKWAVDETRWLEQHPTGDEAKTHVAELLKWWTEVPDLTLSVCPLLLETKNKKISPTVVTMAIFGTGAYLIEHPESTRAEQMLGGVESALRAYSVAVAADPAMKDALLEDLLRAQADGKLREVYVDAAVAKCEASMRDQKKR